LRVGTTLGISTGVGCFDVVVEVSSIGTAVGMFVATSFVFEGGLDRSRLGSELPEGR